MEDATHPLTHIKIYINDGKFCGYHFFANDQRIFLFLAYVNLINSLFFEN